MTLPELIKNKDLRNFVFMRLCYAFGFNMLNTVVSWQVYELTHSYLSLGLIGLAVIVPYIVTSLFSGYVADIKDRKTIIFICQIFYVFVAITMLCLNTILKDTLILYGVWIIYGLMFLTGIIRGFLSPAQSAYVSQLTTRDLYTQVSPWLTLTWHISAVGGPALAGLVYGYFGSESVYVMILIIALLALFFSILLPKKEKPVRAEKETMAESLTKGFSFVFSNQIIWGALTLDMFAVLFGGAVAMLPAFSKEILFSGPETLGFLRAAPAIGGILVGSYLTQHPPNVNAGRKLLWCVAGFGVCTIIFAFSRNYYLSLLALAGTGAFDNVSMVVRGAVAQLYTPDEMRGRVSAVNGIFIGASNELGEMESGLAASAIGLVPSVAVGGCLTLVTVGLIAKFAPKLRDLSLEK
jgi:MFS family permease